LITSIRSGMDLSLLFLHRQWASRAIWFVLDCMNIDRTKIIEHLEAGIQIADTGHQGPVGMISVDATRCARR
jgi:hypothetical protein